MFEKRVTCKLDESFATVVLLRTAEVVTPRFYLARKKQNIHTNDGKELVDSTLWNSYGGKWQKGDKSIKATAKRELYEESGGVKVLLHDLMLGARIEFFWPGNESNVRDMEVFFFTAYKYSKYPQESDSMGPPQLFTAYSAPYKEMMPADDVIIPMLMSGKNARGQIRFTKNDEGKNVVSRKDFLLSHFSQK
jgi:hypothetical protein